MKQKFEVNLTMIYNASVQIEAENEVEAIEIVHNNMDELVPNSKFQFGEKTVDYAELIND